MISHKYKRSMMDACLRHVHELLGGPILGKMFARLMPLMHSFRGHFKFRHLSVSAHSGFPFLCVGTHKFNYSSFQRNWRHSRFGREGWKRKRSVAEKPAEKSPEIKFCTPETQFRVRIRAQLCTSAPSCRRGYGSLTLSSPRLQDGRHALQLLHGSAWPQWCACVGSVAAIVSAVHSCHGETKKRGV